MIFDLTIKETLLSVEYINILSRYNKKSNTFLYIFISKSYKKRLKNMKKRLKFNISAVDFIFKGVIMLLKEGV